MNPERWKQVERLYHAALECEPDVRAPFLNEACAGDEELRLEVTALLAYDGEPASFIEAPVLEVAARELASEQPSNWQTQPLSSPPQITGYQLLAPLGRGGMGEVHLALDTRLNRKVAIKLLPAEFTTQPERVRRFAQEARAASALNHPNIITIHEIGEAGNTHYIVTEYVAGETLRQRLVDAPHHRLQIAEAVDVAAQIAAALAAAHEAGITHRDIKPENVMVRRDGIVKVLDFGLAKLAEERRGDAATRGHGEEDDLVTASPRRRVPASLTAPGMVMGTPRYMSPEQARGLKVDTRTDIFSLGVMLYEMVAGRAPFAGATASEVIAAILRDAPPSPRASNPDLPIELEHLISKALEKDRELRCQSAQEMLADLKRLQRDLSSGRAASMQPVASAPMNATRQPARWRKWAVIGAIPFVILAGLLLWQWRRPLEPPKVTNYIPVTNDGTVFDSPTPFWMMTMVTDGPRLYYSVVAKGRVILNQISGAGGEAVTLPTPFQNALLMDISPSRSELLLVNFTGSTELEAPLWILPIPGGSPRRLGDVRAHAAAWSPNGQQIVYANGSELFLADSNGAGARKLLSVEGRPYWLRWSPDGARLRFSVRRNQFSDISLWEVNADGTNPHPLLPGWPGQNAPAALCCGNWTADGKYFVFQATRHPLVSLWALRENAGSEPVQLTFGPLNFRAPVPSADGRQLFAIGERQRGELVRYDKRTEQWVSYLSGMSAHMLSFSGDGEWMAYVTYPEGSLWRSRMDGIERLQLTFPPMQVYGPRWAPDGKKIAFMAMLPGKSQRIYVVAADGGAPQQLTPEERPETDPSWSPDGGTLAFTSASTPEERAIYLLDLRTGQISPLPSTESIFSPRWSPDGRSIAAKSVNGGKLLLFDLTTKQWTQLTDLNVSYPQWSRDGKYIYFANKLHNDSALMRLRLSDRQLERWASLKDLRLASASFGSWMGLAPDDSPLMLRDVGPQDIYALEWKAP